MINPKTKERELAYIVAIDDIHPIEGKDRVECAVVGGWTIMVQKGRYNPGDLAVYFEIDSLVPSDKECFAFLAKYKYKIKTQKFKNFYSQGLLMSAEELGGITNGEVLHINSKDFHKGDFLTGELGVKYYEIEDQKRKAASADKYKKMAARHPKLFQNPVIKKIYKTNVGKKILYVFFGKKKDGRNWPAWVKKTDEERVENMAFILQNKNPWIATEKIDGTSTTFSMRRGTFFNKPEFYVCSRNVVFDNPDKKCFYDTNVYIEMAEKYNMYNVLSKLLEIMPNAEWVTIQGETFGANIQKRDYGMRDHDFRAFNLITSDRGRFNTKDMTNILKEYDVPSVPIIDANYILPDTIDELRDYVNSRKSDIDGGMKEGIVFRSQDGVHSFKCVSPEFLIKYHQ